MTDRFNTIAGWVLFAGIVALGASIVSGEAFHQERPETMGYPIEGVEVEGEGGEADKPIAFYLQTADAAKGENVFKKCAACHNAEPGGANALGPALYGVMGNPVGGHPGFAFSEPLKSKAMEPRPTNRSLSILPAPTPRKASRCSRNAPPATTPSRVDRTPSAPRCTE